MFKILNGYENIDSNIFFEIKESKITRGHNYTLVKKQRLSSYPPVSQSWLAAQLVMTSGDQCDH